MKHTPLLATILAILGIIATAGADQPRQRAKDVSPDTIVKSAKAMSQSLLDGNFGQLADYTYPKVVELAGGRAKLIELAKESVEKMKKAGYVLTGNQVDAPTGVADAGDDIIAIVPERTEITVPAGKLKITSFLIGVSTDQGATWTFIDGAGVNAGNLKTLLPNFPGELKLPPPPKSEFEPKK